jgi:hypothetical protein
VKVFDMLSINKACDSLIETLLARTTQLPALVTSSSYSSEILHQLGIVYHLVNFCTNVEISPTIIFASSFHHAIHSTEKRNFLAYATMTYRAYKMPGM